MESMDFQNDGSDLDRERIKGSPNNKVPLAVSSPKDDASRLKFRSGGGLMKDENDIVSPPEGNSDEEHSSNEGSLVMADTPTKGIYY